MGITCSKTRLQWKRTGLTAWNGAEKTICPARCQTSLLSIYPKPVSALVWAPISECWIFLSCHVPTITNSYIKCISERAIECTWGSMSEWQKAYKRNEESRLWWLWFSVWAVCQAVPLSLRGDNALLLFHKAGKIIAVNSSVILALSVKPCSFIWVFLKCFCLLSQISNYCSYCCFKHFKLSLCMGWVGITRAKRLMISHWCLFGWHLIKNRTWASTVLSG